MGALKCLSSCAEFVILKTYDSLSLSECDDFQPSSFFPEQLSAFQVWLISSPNSSEPPMQLPIILQVTNPLGSSCFLCFFVRFPFSLSLFYPHLLWLVQFLLSQAHRLQALELLGRYLDTGPEAVHAVCLSPMGLLLAVC